MKKEYVLTSLTVGGMRLMETITLGYRNIMITYFCSIWNDNPLTLITSGDWEIGV